MNAIVLSILFAASVYKCEVDGQPVFSQSPCAEDAQEIDGARLGQSAGLSADEGNIARAEETRAELATESEIRRIWRDADRRIKDHEAKRNVCRANMRRANNNLAGATYLGTQRECVDRYELLIAEEIARRDERIRQLQDQR